MRSMSPRTRRTGVPDEVHESVRRPGRPLDPATRALMQARFAGEHIRPTSGPVPGALATSLTLGRRDDAQEREADAVAARAGAGPATAAPAGPGAGHDFANVRIHTDSRAVASAEAIGADAYTVGQHIVFAPGRYRPESAEGRGLLAHELAHTVQQAGLPEPVVRGKWRMESLKVDSGLEVQREEENAEVSTYGVPGSVYGRARAWQEQGIIRTEVGGVAQVARWTTLHYVFKNDGTDRDFLRLETKGQVTGNAKAEDLDHARASGVVWGGITERTHANPTPPAHKLFEPLEEGSISAATVTDLGTVEVDLPIGEGGSVHGSFKLHRVVQGAAAPFTQSTQPAYDVSPDVERGGCCGGGADGGGRVDRELPCNRGVARREPLRRLRVRHAHADPQALAAGSSRAGVGDPRTGVRRLPQDPGAGHLQVRRRRRLRRREDPQEVLRGRGLPRCEAGRGEDLQQRPGDDREVHPPEVLLPARRLQVPGLIHE